jgi:chain length determinant protein EpsF
MTFSQFLAILRARWVAALVVLMLTITAALAISLLLPKRYTATSALIVDVKSPDPIAGVVLAGMMAPSYMATQVDIITSDRVGRRVARALQLAENQVWRELWRESSLGADFETWAVDRLLRHLDVKPSRESNVIDIGYTDVDPVMAANVANGFVKAYIDTSVELRVEPARQYNSFFVENARQQRELVEKAQAKLAAYQQAKGITSSDERLDIENSRLAELSSQLVALQAMTAETGSRQSQVQRNSEQLSELLNNPLISGMKAELARQEARMQELNSRLGERHPQVLEQQASLGEVRRRLAAETRRVVGSVGVSDTIARARESEVRASLDAQRARVLKLREQREELSVLQRDVEQAQRAYDAVSGRATQTQLEGQTSQSNIAQLSPAIVPPLPSSPKLVLNLIVAVFLGGLLALATALLRELLDRRVRSPLDIVQALELPVLGRLPKPPSKRLQARQMRLQHKRLLGALPAASR